MGACKIGIRIKPRLGPWCVYGLVDPRDGQLFYIGLSARSAGRLREHLRDWGSGARDHLQAIAKSGLAVECIEFAWYDQRETASDTELRIISEFWETLTNQCGSGRSQRWPSIKSS